MTNKEVTLLLNRVNNGEQKAYGELISLVYDELRRMAAGRMRMEASGHTLQPTALVLLGATAAQAMLGRSFKVTERRGELIDSPLAPVVTATVHPSSILRAPDDLARRDAMGAFVEDLRAVVRAVTEPRE